jgi:hypothetical protein
MENFALLPHRAEAHTTVLSKPVGQCFRTCPDAEHILAGLAAQENGPKVWNVINRGSCANQRPKEIFFPEIRPGRTPVEAVPVLRIGSRCLQECSRVHGPQPD